MYIIIQEDGEITRREEIDQSYLDASDDGLLDIIRVDGPLPMRYNQRVWEPVEKG